MKCQILFSGKNKKNISKCRLLKILPRMLSDNNSTGLDITYVSFIYGFLFSVCVSDTDDRQQEVRCGYFFCAISSYVALNCTDLQH